MAKGTTKASGAFDAIKKRAKGSFKKSQKKEAKVKGAMLPPGIVRGVAQLIGFSDGKTKDERKTPYITLTLLAHEPSNAKGTKFSLSYFFEDRKDRKTQEITKTVDDVVDQLVSDLKLIAGEDAVNDLDMDNELQESIEALVEAKPFCYFNTWKPEKRPTDTRDPRTLAFIQGHAEDYEGEVDEEVEDEEEDETEDEEQEEEEEKPRGKKPSTKPSRNGKKPTAKAEEPEEDEEAEEEEDEEYVFDPDLVYAYKFGKKLANVEIVKYYEKTNKVDIKNMETQKVVKGVSVDDLADPLDEE
jgi:hypothetical protein